MKFIIYSIKKIFSGYLWIFTAAVLLDFTGCHKNDEPVPNDSVSAETRSINNFILDNMKYYYLWADFIPGNLNPNTEPDPRAFFNKMLYTTDDKWSYITDDYQGLINSFQGVNQTFGYQFKLFREQSGDNIFGIIEYVLPGSPADSAGIKRGDIFISVNNTLLNTTNYKDLLFGVTHYTLGFADLVDNSITPNGKSSELNAVTFQEDPIFYTHVYNVGGEKIGYLVYNQFISNYDDELKSVFLDFKSQGINDLVLDFRYDPGGSVNTAEIMASMIAPREVVSQQKVFAKYIWNSTLNDYIVKKEGSDSRNLILKFFTDELPENLNLKRVYVIITGNTASASELVINALKPYMTVYTIGSNSVGKYTASITLHDQTKSYNWAIQPIVVKLANANDVSDYKNGFTPDFAADDDYFSELGSLNENMLATAISQITGIPVGQLARVKEISNLKKYLPIVAGSMKPVDGMQRMYIDQVPFQKEAF